MSRMRQSYYSFRSRWGIISKDLAKPFPLSLPVKVGLWRRGFLAEKHVLYDFDQRDWRQFLSDYHTSQARWINEPYNEVLTNKFIFWRVMRQGVRVPETYALVLDGRIREIDGSGVRDAASLLARLHADGALVLKPVTGGGGRGVMTVEVRGTTIHSNNKPVEEAAFLQGLGALDDYIVTEFIRQGEFSRSLHPASTNTLRVVTLVDPESGEPFIARAVQRIGNKGSAPQDNFTRGGLSSRIDLETGELGPAASHPKTRVLDWHEVHPDTGERFVGRRIPDWDRVKADILAAARHAPFLHVIGWDIALTDQGIVAIEGNHHPDPDVLQCHAPMLADERIRRFYKHHRII